MGAEMSNEPLESAFPVRLKIDRYFGRQILFMGGMFSGLFLPAAISSLRSSDWHGLLFPLIPLGAFILARLSQRFLEGSKIVLFEDRMELPFINEKQKSLTWSDVSRIRWSIGDSASIQFIPSSDSSKTTIHASLIGLSSKDCLTFLRYLRERGSKIEQDGWPRFCRRYAVRCAESLQNAENEKNNETRVHFSAITDSPVLKWYLKIYKRWPFLSGLLFWAIFLLLIPAFLSRKVWWALSFLMAVSTVLNSMPPLGGFDNNITKIALGFCGSLFLIGIFAPKETGGAMNKADTVRGGWIWVGSGFIFLPFLMVIAGKGWIRHDIPLYGIVIYLFSFLTYAVIHEHKKGKPERQLREEREQAAVRRWEVFQETGRLPEANLREG
jgi:hypothetical protein